VPSAAEVPTQSIETIMTAKIRMDSVLRMSSLLYLLFSALPPRIKR
jgi:hypothetical protein